MSMIVSSHLVLRFFFRLSFCLAQSFRCRHRDRYLLLCLFCSSSASIVSVSSCFSSFRFAILCQVNSCCSKGSHLIACKNSFRTVFIFSDFFHFVALVLALSSSVKVNFLSPPAITTSFGPISALNFSQLFSVV